MLEQAGWHVCDADQANIHAAQGVAIREWQDFYPKLSDADKAAMPLYPVYFLAPDD